MKCEEPTLESPFRLSKSESIISLKKKNRVDWREWVSRILRVLWYCVDMVHNCYEVHGEEKIESPTCGGKERNPNIVHYCEVWMWPALMSTYYYNIMTDLGMKPNPEINLEFDQCYTNVIKGLMLICVWLS